MITKKDSNTDDKPLISVVIPTYKRAQFLPRAIDSVLNQTYSNIEVIVVDDNVPNSKFRNETEEVMESYLENIHIRYVRHSENRNGAAARNTGITVSNGIYICFLDDDDWYLPDKIEKQLRYLQEHPQFDAVYCGCERDGKVFRPYKEGDLSFELLSGINIIYTNTILIKRENAIACGGWDERFCRNQEAVFLLRFFSGGGKIGALSDVLVKFDISDASNRSNPTVFEKDFDLFLKMHQDEIKRCSLRYPDAAQMIYSYRYRGVLLNYIKHGRIREALLLYRKMTYLLPGRFKHDCMIYIIRKLTGKALFKEFEKENHFE